jgi:hypothetical protein
LAHQAEFIKPQMAELTGTKITNSTLPNPNNRQMLEELV